MITKSPEIIWVSAIVDAGEVEPPTKTIAAMQEQGVADYSGALTLAVTSITNGLDGCMGDIAKIRTELGA